MKKTIAVLLSIVVSGCIHFTPVSYEEQCAHKNMKFVGVNTYTSSGMAYGMNGNTALVSSSGEGVMCVVPQNANEACLIRQMKQEADPKLEYNASVPMRRYLAFYAYMAFIVPGIIVSSVADADREKALAASEEAQRNPASVCSASNSP